MGGSWGSPFLSSGVRDAELVPPAGGFVGVAGCQTFCRGDGLERAECRGPQPLVLSCELFAA